MAKLPFSLQELEQQDDSGQESQGGKALPFTMQTAEASTQTQTRVGPMGIEYSYAGEQEPQEQESGEFTKGVKRGFYETGAALAAGGGALADFAGDIAGYAGFESGEELLASVGDDAVQQANDLMQTAQQYDAEVGNVEDISNPAEFVSWASGVLGEQVPTIAGAVATGGVGSVIGKVAAKKALSKRAKDELEDKAQQWASRGAVGGTAGFTATAETGGIYQEQQRETEADSPGTALLFGSAAGALDALPFVTVARSLGLGNKAKSSLLGAIEELPRGKRALATAALVSGQEAGTESAQEALAIAARDVVDEEYETLSEENASRLINAAAAGGLVGGAVGGISGAVGETAPAQEGGLPPVQSLQAGTQAPQQGEQQATAQPQRQVPGLPVPPIYAEPPQGTSPAPAQQDLFGAYPAQPGTAIQESPVPQTEAPQGPALDLSQQLSFEGFPRIVSIDDKGQAAEMDQESFTLGLEEQVEGTPGFGGDSLKRLIRGPQQPDPDSELPQGEEVEYSSTAPDIQEETQQGIVEEYEDTTTGQEFTPAGEIAEGSQLFNKERDARQESNARRRRQQREETREVRRRVEQRRQREGQQQELSDSELNQMLREQGIDPDELFGIPGAEDIDPTDLLESREDANRFARQQKQKKQQSEEHVSAVQRQVQELYDLYPGLQDIALIVQRRTDYISQYGARDPRTKAALRPNTRAFYVSQGQGQAGIHIIADKVSPNPSTREKEVLRNFTHEALIHGGLDALLNEQEKDNLRNLVLRKAKDTELWEEINNAYPEASELKKAEEYIARVGQDGVQMSFLRRVAALIRKALRRVFGDRVSKLTNDEIRVMLGDIQVGLQGQGTRSLEAIKPYISSTGRTYSHPQAAHNDTLLEAIDFEYKDDQRQIGKDLETQASVWKAKLKNMFLTPLQLAQEYGIEPLQRYYQDVVPRWWNVKSEILDVAEQELTNTQGMGQDRVDTLGRMLFRATLESDEQGRRLGPEELLELWKDPDGVIQKKPIEPDQELLDRYWQIDASIRQVTDRLEQGLKRNAIREAIPEEVPNPYEATEQILDVWDRYAGDETQRVAALESVSQSITGQELTVIARLQEIESQFDRMRHRNYFPLMRFGRFTVSLTAQQDGVEYDGQTYNAGEVILFETHEGVREQKQRREELDEELGGRSDIGVHAGKLTDEEFSFLGMPPALQQSITNELQLTEDQQTRLNEIFIKMSPGRSFLKHQLRRKGTAGFSTDVLQTYAGYMTQAAGHLARTETYVDMQQAMRDMDNLSKEMLRTAPTTDSTVADTLRDGMAQHYNWIMNPRSEFAGLRNLGFQWYLGFNPRSAVVNLTQIPLATYPYLAERYGDTAAVQELSKAYKAGARTPRGEETELSDPAQQMMRRGAKEGWIDESLATEVAGFAESDVVKRLMPSDKATKLMNNFSYYSGWMFSHAEQYNRRVAAVAAYNLARKNGNSHEEGINAAREAVQNTQFEYAKWNRPRFMRGKQSIFFLFWQYMQHATYLAAGRHGKGTAMRFWLMLGLAGGLQGLPYADLFMELFNSIGTKTKEMLGLKDPKVDLQEDLREFAHELNLNPEMMMHGLSRYYGLGPLHILEAFNVPVPNVDISGSLSMGAFPPGAVEAAQGDMGRATQAAAGPVLGVPIAVWKTLSSDDPNVWKEWEQPLPTVLRNASRAIRYGQQGEETQSSGAQLVEYDPFDTQHRAEIIAQALGFPSTRKQAAWEETMAKAEAKRYWLTRRTLLMQDYFWSSINDSREGKADVRKAIKQFNQGVPSRALAISVSDLKRSLERRYQSKYRVEAGRPSSDMLHEVFTEIDTLYGTE